MKTLILGGIRSGKSRLAERLASDSGKPVSYIATATALDDEMQARIAEHRAHRPADWRVIEEPIHLVTALKAQASEQGCIIVDCITLWLTNLLMQEDMDLLAREIDAVVSAIPSLPGEIIMVSNETNMGVIPLGELSRLYCDEAGQLNQSLARCCDRVILTVAGLPQVLKDTTKSNVI
jgi:adenosylcobinamide kinase/adenosylcobinamide-phosphate guanylyltransferase